jgi:hypothetical protein
VMLGSKGWTDGDENQDGWVQSGWEVRGFQ